ncbi:MAG: restriction endonuclease subunit S [bacterium]|nr:restriction endonuclease subunit S [bacterium]
MKSGWQQKTFGEILLKTETVNPQAFPNSEFDYVDVSSVSNQTYEIMETQRIRGKDAPSRARRLIKANDVIFATVRPTLQRIAIVPEYLDNQVCSTGYFVLRPKSIIGHKYMFYWLFSEYFMSQMEILQKGASYPAVTDAEVQSQSIPFPSLVEQQRIVAILDEAFEGIAIAKANAEKNLKYMSDIISAGFISLTLKENQTDWPLETVASIAASQKGSIRTGPFGSQLLHSEFVDSGIAVLGIDNAVFNEFRWAKSRYITQEKYQQLQRYRVHPGDVLITIMGTCGRCAIVPDDVPIAINTKHLCCITLNRKKCLPRYLHAYFLYHPVAQEFLSRQAKGAIMAGLNMGLIEELPVILPSVEQQIEIVNSFDSLISETKHLTSINQQKIIALESLKKSLLDQAFSGNLTDKVTDRSLAEAAL